MKNKITIPKKFKSIKPHEQRLKDGDICDIETAAHLTGYSVQHLRRLCHDKAVGHERRNGHEFFFTPDDIKSVQARVEPKA